MLAIHDLLLIDSYELNELLDNKKVRPLIYFFNLKEMNCADLEKLGEAIEDSFAKEWYDKYNCKDTIYSLDLVA